MSRRNFSERYEKFRVSQVMDWTTFTFLLTDSQGFTYTVEYHKPPVTTHLYVNLRDRILLLTLPDTNSSLMYYEDIVLPTRRCQTRTGGSVRPS